MKFMLVVLLALSYVGVMYGQEYIEVKGDDPPPPKYRISAYQNDLGDVRYWWETRCMLTSNGWAGAPWYRATYGYFKGHIVGFKTHAECRAELDAEIRKEQAHNWKRIETP